MGFIAAIIIGALAGWIAGKIMRSNGGLIKNIIVGVVGSFVGGLIFQFLGFGSIARVSIAGIVVSVIGACILIAVVRAITK